MTLHKHSYRRKYNSSEAELSPQSKVFIGAPRKNSDYTLKNKFLVNE